MVTSADREARLPPFRRPHLEDSRILALRERIAGNPPRPGPAPEGSARASVALVVRPGAEDLEVLLIRRAEYGGDPWSGHMALPGGRRSPADRDGLATAVRETHEEVGIDLAAEGLYLGALDEVHPREGAPRISIAPYAYAVPAGTTTTINHEVDVALWIPVGRMAEPGAATEYLHALSSGESLRFPAIGFQEYVIWGLTHRILTRFLEIALHTPSSGGSR